MSPDSSVAKVAGKDESQGSGGRRNGSSSSRKQEPALKCPRCDSSNTKFCYYNNYNLSQPRHFCKTCRRYWTKGGALRNVPIGGGCRKNKKLKSRLSGDGSKEYSGGVPKLNFLEGFSPAMDFQLGGLNYLSRNNIVNQPQNSNNLVNQFSSGEIAANPCFNLDFSAGMGFNFPLGINQEMGSSSSTFNLATSMETLSSMNQNMHWKLQQERLGTFLEPNQQIEKPQPILFHNLEISKPEAIGTSNYAQGTTTPPPSNSSSNANENNPSNWNNAMAWSNLNQYSIL